MAVTNERAGRTVRLPDGRLLGYAEFGFPRGAPVLFFHGQPGSRLSGRLLASSAEAAGVRLIALDRPGFGLSDYQPDRTRADWPGDVEQVADYLALDRFGVLGWSAGGPYALACGALIPHRLTVVGVLAGLGQLGALDPVVVRSLLSIRFSGNLEALPEVLARTWTRTRSAAGSGVEMAQESSGVIAAGIREGLREGPAGALHELRLLGRRWDFDPASIAGLPVRFWHGKADAVVPSRQTRALVAQVPGAQASYIPGAGHVSLLTLHGRDVLHELARCAR